MQGLLLWPAMESPFLLTLGLIFLAALVGIYFNRRARDACLKDFGGFRITIEYKDGRRVWGRLTVFPQDIELFYNTPNRDSQGHDETSYVLFANEVAQLQTVLRYHDELSPANQKRRLADIRRSHHPNVFRRGYRSFRNFLNTFRDAFNQSIGTVLSQAKKQKANNQVLQSGSEQLGSIGTTVLGAAANAYEPILERYIGRKVVVEEKREDDWVEHVGILKEYTAGWIELLDCREVRRHQFELTEIDRLLENRDLDFSLHRSATGLALEIENHGDTPLQFESVTGQDYAVIVDVAIAPGQSHRVGLTLPEELSEGLDALPEHVVMRGGGRGDGQDDPTAIPPLPPLTVVLRGERAVDLCLPRAHSVLRHGGEPIETWRERLTRRRAEGA